MALIEYISDNEFTLRYNEPDVDSQCYIEFDVNILKLINKKYNTREEEGYPPEAEYNFKIIKHKPTKINLINEYDTGETTYITVDVNNSQCIVI